jgi:hypothetical protein
MPYFVLKVCTNSNGHDGEDRQMLREATAVKPGKDANLSRPDG